MPRKKTRITITLDEKLVKNIDGLIDGISIKNRSHAIEFFLSKNLKQERITAAVVLAGGRGICVNGKVPASKAAISIEGRSVMSRNLSWLQKEGIKKVYIFAGKFEDSLRSEIESGLEYDLDISFMPGDYGTAGSLKCLEGLLDETFLLINGDVFCEAKINHIYDFHRKMGGCCTICMTSKRDPSFYGTIKLSGNKVVDFTEKPQKGKEQSYLINAGMYLFEPKILKIISAYGCKSLERNLFPALSKKGSVYGYYLEERWNHLK